MLQCWWQLQGTLASLWFFLEAPAPSQKGVEPSPTQSVPKAEAPAPAQAGQPQTEVAQA